MFTRPGSAPPAKRGNDGGRVRGGNARAAAPAPAAAPAQAEPAAQAVAAEGDAEPEGSLNCVAAVNDGTNSFDTLDACQYGDDGEEVLWNNGKTLGGMKGSEDRDKLSLRLLFIPFVLQ